MSLNINDVYTVNDFGAQNASLTSFLYNSSLTTSYNIPNMALRNTIVRQNIGYTAYQRSIMEAESLGVLQTQFSRASALLKEPQHRLVLKHLNQFDNDDRLTHDDTTNTGITNSTGMYRDAALSKEMVFKELEVKII